MDRLPLSALFAAISFLIGCEHEPDGAKRFFLQSSAQSSARENFFSKKHTHVGSLVNTKHPACCIYHFTLQNLQSSAQNPFRAEDFCSTIIETHQKSHRKPTDLPQISYRGPETCREFHTRFSKIKFLTNFLNISLRMCRKMITFVPEFNLRREFSKISIE